MIETTGIEDIPNHLATKIGNTVAVVTVILEIHEIQETREIEIIIPLLHLVTLLPLHVILTVITAVVMILIPVVAGVQDVAPETEEKPSVPLAQDIDREKKQLAFILQIILVPFMSR